MLAFQSDRLADIEKPDIMLRNLYPVMPKNTLAAIEWAGWFLNCGDTSEKKAGPKVYDFQKDAPLIYAGFRQIHGIDLHTVKLHWWSFVALFMAVMACQDTPFGALVTLRSRVKNGQATKEEKEAARKLGDMFTLPEPDRRSFAEKEAARKKRADLLALARA